MNGMTAACAGFILSMPDHVYVSHGWDPHFKGPVVKVDYYDVPMALFQQWTDKKLGWETPAKGFILEKIDGQPEILSWCDKLFEAGEISQISCNFRV